MSLADDIIKKQRQVMEEIKPQSEYIYMHERYAKALPDILDTAHVPSETAVNIVEAFVAQNFERCLTLLKTAYEERKKQEPDSDKVARLCSLVGELEIISQFK